VNYGPQCDYTRAAGRALNYAEGAPDTEAKAEFAGLFYLHSAQIIPLKDRCVTTIQKIILL